MTGCANPRLFRFGVFEVDLQTQELRKCGVRIRLNGQPFELLMILLERRGEVVTREELRQRLWPADTFVDFDHGLNNAVNRIRQTLTDSASSPRFVETLPRRGYRFVAPVEAIGDRQASLVSRSTASLLRKRWTAIGALAMAVALVLVGAYHRSPVNPRSASEAPAAAQAAYWKGLHQLGKYDPVSLQRACEHLEEAVSIEPRFASARAALADCYNRMAAWGLAGPQPAYAKAIREAELALAVDPREARAHLALGEARLFLHWDWDGAKRAHLRALELAPELPLAHKSYALLLVSKGRVKEALRHMEESRRLAPLDIRIQTQYGEMLYLARRYHDATAQLELAVGMDPEYPAARKYLSDAYAQIGRYEAAAAQFEDWLALVGVDAGERSEAARILARHGPAGVARRTISRHNAQACENYGAPHKLAASHAALNDPGRSVEWLEQAYAQRDPRLMFLKIDPQFDRVRSDRRFQELLMRIGL